MSAIDIVVETLGGNPRSIWLEGHELDVCAGDRPVLFGLDLELRGGQRVLVRGANGSGKSSLLNVLAQRTRAAAGTLSWRRGTEGGEPAIFYLPQYPILFPGLRVVENLAIMAGRRVPDVIEAVSFLVSDSPLREVIARLPNLRQRADQLSTGQQRLILFMAAEISGADIFLLDEPWAGLHDDLSRSCSSRARTWAETGRLVVIATPEQPAESCEGDA